MTPTTVQQILYCTSSVATLLYIATATIASAIATEQKPNFGSRRRIHHVVLILILAFYFAQASISVYERDVFSQGQPRLVQLILLGCAWFWILLRPSDPASIPAGVAILGVAFDTPLLVLSCLRGPGLESHLAITSSAIQCSRILLLVIVAAVSLRSVYIAARSSTGRDDVWKNHVEGPAKGRNMGSELTVEQAQSDAYHDDPERESNEDTLTTASDDSIGSDDSEDEDVAKIKQRRAERLKETGGWLAYVKDFSIFLPCLIPKKNNRKIQLCLLVSLGCVAANRVLNILIPRQMGIVTDTVMSGQGPYGALAIWLALNLVDEYRALGIVQTFAKIPIQQFSYRAITNMAFNHVMTLSMDFHADRDSAEVIKAIEQGTSINYILETLTIDLLPMLSDIIIAMVLFWCKFNALVALVVFISAIVIVSVEVSLMSKNVGNKRTCTKTAREESRVMHQAMQGWQTVTYFNMFGFEKRRFAQAIGDYLDASKTFQKFDAMTDAILESLEPITFFLLASIVLYEVRHGQASTGDFVFALQYWQSLVWPIKLLSHNSKLIMESLVDAERLLALLQTKPSVADKPDAKDLYDVQGRVVFENVGFCYDPRKSIIDNLSLSASPGQTVAFVGATGAGKSTIIKLLMRFHDVNAGRITIDEHDIRDITLSSLRSSLGIVPQDPLLFNATIMENLRYARRDASDEEVFEACRNAAVHDKIVGFADGYETKAGEQGVKLSGGEIQRLAIARVFLKNPPILILDEATSAVDTETEHSIQQALNGLARGRTTFIIAHRLSTIVHADKIMVVSDGAIIESGTHAELIKVDGKYKSLWSKQSGGML